MKTTHKKKKNPHRGSNKNNNKPIRQALQTTSAASPPPPNFRFQPRYPNPVTDDFRCAEGEPIAFLSAIAAAGWRPSLLTTEQGTKRQNQNQNQKTKTKTKQKNTPTPFLLPTFPPNPFENRMLQTKPASQLFQELPRTRTNSNPSLPSARHGRSRIAPTFPSLMYFCVFCPEGQGLPGFPQTRVLDASLIRGTCPLTPEAREPAQHPTPLLETPPNCLHQRQTASISVPPNCLHESASPPQPLLGCHSSSESTTNPTLHFHKHPPHTHNVT